MGVVSDIWNGAKDIVGGVGDAVGEGAKDFQRVGMNKFNAQQAPNVDVNWGGSPDAAANWAKMGAGNMQNSQGLNNWAQNQAQWDRGATAVEDQTLANREADARYGDQSGALQLSREAAMGMAPSAAAYQMQSGLDQATAQQAAMAGGARGAAALANAQGNAGNNVAALQNQAYNQGGQLRAQEMANARTQYGQMADTQRAQDQSRLQMGNQMSQYNAGANDQYKLGMGNLANGASAQAQGWYNAAQNPLNQQMNAQAGNAQLNSGNFNNQQALNASVSTGNADLANANKQQMVGFFSQAGNSAVNAARGMGGSVKP